METYLIAKFLHVVSALVWLGGGFVMVFLGVLAERAKDERRFMDVIVQIASLAKVFFIPSSLLTLLTGIATVLIGGLAWEAWIILGLSGIAFTATFGTMVLGPLAEKAVPVRDESTGLGYGRRLVDLIKFDYTIQFSIVWLMVTKPGWADFVLLLIPVIAIVAGAALFLRPRNIALA